MPTISINKARIEDITKLSINKVKSLLSHFFEVEETKEALHVEIPANRPDLVSIYGIARLIKNQQGKSIDYAQFIQKGNFEVYVDKSVKSVRPFTACAVAYLHFDESRIKEIIEIQENLHRTWGRDRKKIAIGIYPLKQIKWPIYYKALKPELIHFVPLGFRTELNGLEILKEHETGKKYAHLLEGKEKFPVFIDSANQILSMPPIINSALTGRIKPGDEAVFIECSGLNWQAVLSTINLITIDLIDMGAKIKKVRLNYAWPLPDGKKKIETPVLEKKKIKINLEKLNSILGIKLKTHQIEKLLKKAGLVLNKNIVEIPAYRTDLLEPIDIAEEIATFYGYESIKPSLASCFGFGKADPFFDFQLDLAELLTGLGFVEVKNFCLIPEKEAKLIAKPYLKVKSKTERNVLRQSLLPSMLSCLALNKDKRYPQLIFEIGKIFDLEKRQNERQEVKEKTMLSFCLAQQKADQTSVIQVLEWLAEQLQLKYELSEIDLNSTYLKNILIEGRVAEIKINKEQLGLIGEIYPALLSELNIEMPVACAEIDLDKLWKMILNQNKQK